MLAFFFLCFLCRPHGQHLIMFCFIEPRVHAAVAYGCCGDAGNLSIEHIPPDGAFDRLSSDGPRCACCACSLLRSRNLGLGLVVGFRFNLAASVAFFVGVYSRRCVSRGFLALVYGPFNAVLWCS